MAGAAIYKWVVSMSLSRQQIAQTLRRVGLEDAAADALATLPDQVQAEDLEQFCVAHGLSVDDLVDRMGGTL
jgi:hypothetical protein